MGFTRRVWACEGLAPPCPLGCLVSLSISTSLSFCWRWWGQSWSFPAEFLRFRDCWEDVSLMTRAPCAKKQDSLPSPLWTSICLCQMGMIMSTVPGTIYLSYQLIGYVHTTLKHESSLLYECRDCWNMVSGGELALELIRAICSHTDLLPCHCHQKLMVLTVFIRPLKYKCLLKIIISASFPKKKAHRILGEIKRDFYLFLLQWMSGHRIEEVGNPNEKTGWACF